VVALAAATSSRPGPRISGRQPSCWSATTRSAGRWTRTLTSWSCCWRRSC